MPSTSLALYMQAQRELYLAGLPAKVAELDTALQRYQQTSDEDSALTALAQAHKLAGSGGTFGFPAISDAAAAIEKVLSGAVGVRQAMSPDGRAALQSARATLARALEGAASGLVAGSGPHAPPVLTGTMPRPRGAPLVLIVEADAQVARQLAAQLKSFAFQGLVVERPEQIAAALSGHPAPTAILAAMAFCGDPLLTQHASSTAPLIFILGGNDFSDRLKTVRAGASAYFPTPLDINALAGLLDRLSSAEPARPYRVLIVDDDETLAAFYAGVLQAAGMQTLAISDPREVMASLADFRPDLITCDLHMPQCNGAELAAVIRQQQELVRIPIVFLSTETSLDRQAQALRQGGDDFILKPVDPAALVAAAQSRARRYRSLLEAEDTLRISEERFRLVVQTSLDGFIQTLADGTVISANPAACAMFGMTEQQMQGAGIVRLMDAGDKRVAHMLEQRSRTGEFSGELTCVHGDGRRFPVEVSSSQHLGSQGELQISVILRDITERKHAEQQIMQLNAELETRVAQRTAELTVANQELQSFSHSLAHDLRQPYIAINGLTSLLEREMSHGVSERGKHYLQRIRAGVSQMNERTDSLLALAQLSRAHIRREPLDLGAMAKKVLAALRQQDTDRQVKTDVQESLAVFADAALVLHLLKILLGNAWKFSAREAMAHISLRSETGPAGETFFVVGDNGAGFDMAYADKLFGAFQRLHAPEDFPGAGIGLATARRIVTRHGGRIWAQSAPGDGARLYFTLEPASPQAPAITRA